MERLLSRGSFRCCRRAKLAYPPLSTSSSFLTLSHLTIFLSIVRALPLITSPAHPTSPPSGALLVEVLFGGGVGGRGFSGRVDDHLSLHLNLSLLTPCVPPPPFSSSSLSLSPSSPPLPLRFFPLSRHFSLVSDQGPVTVTGVEYTGDPTRGAEF